VLRAMPLVLTLQCATVFAIESAERIALGAPPPHGLLWLGAPVLISLTFHLAIGLVCALALTAALRALLGWCAALVAGVLDVVLATLAGPPRPCLAARAEARAPARRTRAPAPHHARLNSQRSGAVRPGEERSWSFQPAR
jgi:hypothetical protein